ncbi:hypothetical protein D9757_015439 [Collybiopsis confluens]|uniref:SUN domain-containing protein n=1 Tax=Collybiopsis confluens TaxID=2823264 RepID=A0A8H5CHE2_9AGAR|nr:hypothetical protein D9757_015439 [Collybiopsis confluens]
MHTRKKRAPSYANDDFWPEYLKEKPGPVKDGGERTHSSYPYADSSAERSFDLVKSSSNVIQVFVGSIFSAFATCSRLVWSLSNALGGSIIVIFIITSSIGAFIPSDIRSHVPRPCASRAPPTAPADLSPPLGALNHTETDADYALANDGAYVIKALTSPTAGLRPLSLLEKVAAVARGYDKSQIHINPPSIVLEDGLDSGCWKFEGSQGHVALSLTSPILWQGFGLHFPKKRSLTDETIRQAPKDILLWHLS